MQLSFDLDFFQVRNKCQAMGNWEGKVMLTAM